MQKQRRTSVTTLLFPLVLGACGMDTAGQVVDQSSLALGDVDQFFSTVMVDYYEALGVGTSFDQCASFPVSYSLAPEFPGIEITSMWGIYHIRQKSPGSAEFSEYVSVRMVLREGEAVAGFSCAYVRDGNEPAGTHGWRAMTVREYCERHGAPGSCDHIPPEVMDQPQYDCQHMGDGGPGMTDPGDIDAAAFSRRVFQAAFSNNLLGRGCTTSPSTDVPECPPDVCTPDGEDPGEPDPGEPEPGTPDGGTPEPGEPEPGTPDGGTPDPGTLEPGTLDPGDGEIGVAVHPAEIAVIMACLGAVGIQVGTWAAMETSLVGVKMAGGGRAVAAGALATATAAHVRQSRLALIACAAPTSPSARPIMNAAFNVSIGLFVTPFPISSALLYLLFF
jgi:hypothetical protein